MKVSTTTSFATLIAFTAAASVASPQGEAIVERDNDVDWSSLISQGTAAWSQLSSSLSGHPELQAQVNGLISKAISAYGAATAQHKRDDVPMTERDNLDWGSLLSQGTAVWSQVQASLSDHPDLQAKVNGFISKAISAYGSASSAQQKREVMELAVRDFGDIVQTVINLVKPLVSNILSSVDWNSLIVKGGTYLVAVAEQVYQWAKSSGNLDKFMSWLKSNLGTIVSTLLQWVLGALFGGSSTTNTGNSGATTVTVAAATATANQAKRMLY